jgi:hypothetical protein
VKSITDTICRSGVRNSARRDHHETEICDVSACTNLLANTSVDLLSVNVSVPYSGGSGSSYIYGLVDATYREGMTKQECQDFVKKCEPSRHSMLQPFFRLDSKRFVWMRCRHFSCYGQRRVVWWRRAVGHYRQSGR